ncbi:MAG: hypothetical protein GY796_20620 [Chloroflexi bacterium]|nr:hypothetical protein [Chloroflexota bacterium]
MINKDLKKKIDAQLQIKQSVTTTKYRRFVKKYDIESLTAPRYWHMIPTYTISQCPICHTVYRQAVDTYSLYFWNNRHNLESVAYSPEGYERCEHFVGVHLFLNLNGRLPGKKELMDEVLFSSEPEIPMITPLLLPNDIESYAVLHSIPICQLWGKQFRPLYNLFMLTYFSINKRMLERRRLLEWTDGIEITSLLEVSVPWINGNKRLMLYWEEASYIPEAWDLMYWVRKGKLRWLDLNEPNLPLNNQDDAFPYIGLDGKHTGYKYKDKKFKIVHTHPTIEEFRESLDKFW